MTVWALLFLVVAAVAVVLVMGDSVGEFTKTVIGYVQGRPTTLEVVEVAPNQWMRADAGVALSSMLLAALRDGHALSVTSAWRSNDEQAALRALYESGRGNLAAVPGWSNHQGGTAVDLGGVLSYTSPAYAWLAQHAKAFGFVNDVRGEYWHWHFVG